MQHKIAEGSAIEVINSLGQIVLTDNRAPGEKSYHFQLDVSTLQEDIYILIVKTESGVSTEVFVKR